MSGAATGHEKAAGQDGPPREKTLRLCCQADHDGAGLHYCGGFGALASMRCSAQAITVTSSLACSTSVARLVSLNWASLILRTAASWHDFSTAAPFLRRPSRATRR